MVQKNNVPIYDMEDILWFKEMAEYSVRFKNKKQSEEEIEKVFNDLYKHFL